MRETERERERERQIQTNTDRHREKIRLTSQKYIGHDKLNNECDRKYNENALKNVIIVIIMWLTKCH